MGTLRPDLIMKSLIPVVMAGIIAVYGLVVSVLIVGALNPSEPYSLYAGSVHLAAGLSCGLTGLAAGKAIGVVGDACARAYLLQSRVFVAMVLMLVSPGAGLSLSLAGSPTDPLPRCARSQIFAEVIGLYGREFCTLSLSLLPTIASIHPRETRPSPPPKKNPIN